MSAVSRPSPRPFLSRLEAIALRLEAASRLELSVLSVHICFALIMRFCGAPLDRAGALERRKDEDLLNTAPYPRFLVVPRRHGAGCKNPAMW